jgi:hypothetical protein
MAYTIHNNDGTVLTTIAVGEVDNYSTSLDLIGKNINNYGEYYNTNLVKLLTSFASPVSDIPRSPQTGQLWFDKTAKRLKVFDGTNFQPTYGSHVSGTAPVTTSTGDFWYDTVNSQLKVWNGNAYNLIGPATSGLLGKFGILPAANAIRDEYSKVVQKAGVINSYGSYVGLITTASFTMESSSSTVFLKNGTDISGSTLEGKISKIVEGITVFKDLDVKGDIRVSRRLLVDSSQIVGIRTDLTAYYNITPYGTYTATMTSGNFGLTNTNYLNYSAANYAIAKDLSKMFDPLIYRTGSRVSVTTAYNSEYAVRQFELTKLYPQQQVPWWEPLTNYGYTFTATSTSTVGQVQWLWSSTTYINVMQPAWNEVIRTDNTATTSNSYLNPVSVGTTFYIKVTGGIPYTGFSIAGVAPLDTTTRTFALNSNGEYTTSSIITNLIQPVTTSVNYAYNLNFFATGNVRTLQFTALRP